jgi:uncharacterized membrane protein
LLSAWLWVLHVRTYLWPSESSFCSFDAKFDCVQVAASPSSVFLGVPWAAYGCVGFLALTALIVRRSILALPLSLLMGIGSLGLLGVELFQVGSICLWCEAVHILTWILAALLIRGRAALVRDEKNLVTVQLGVVLPLTLLVTLWAFLPRYWGALSYKAPPSLPTGVTEEGYPWIGSTNPSVVIHEFVDYRCPHCKVASTQTLRKLARNSRVRVVRRHQPRMHCNGAGSCESMRVALCAAKQNKFWQADRYLFEVAESGNRLDLSKAARDLSLNEAELKTCYESAETLAEADRQAKEARKAKIHGTPGYIVDGKRVTAGAVQKLFEN